jgi:ribose-phosphate pyrophosphokinase
MTSHLAPLIFALHASHELGIKIAAQLQLPIAAHEEREFADGEHKIRPLENVRDRDVYVVQSLYGDAKFSVNDKLCRLLFFIGALKDAGAARVTVVAPYLCYSRKDRRTKFQDPVTSRYIASLFEAVGSDCVVTLDVHNLQAFQNGFRCRTEHLGARTLFVDHFVAVAGNDKVTVVSPDEGGVHRSEAFRRAFAHKLGRHVDGGFMEKRRSQDVVSGEHIVGEFRGRTVIVIDDLISTGATLLRVAKACRERGAVRVLTAASHGLFSSNAAIVLSDFAIDQVVVTSSVPPFQLSGGGLAGKLLVLEIAPLLAECIQRLHQGRSIAELTDLQE